MVPVYFPHTYLSETTLAGLAACFRSVVLYQPTQRHLPARLHRWQQDGRVEIRIPVTTQEQEIDDKLKAFTHWGGMHAKSQLDFYRYSGETVPFFSDTATANIRAEIKKNAPASRPDPLFTARLFLQFAQEFDRQNEEMHQELAALAKREHDLFSSLRGTLPLETADASTSGKTEAQRGAEFMVPERMVAWAHLYRFDLAMQKGPRPSVFVTSQRAVIDWLGERNSAMQKVLSIDSIPLGLSDDGRTADWRVKIDEALASLCTTGPGGQNIDFSAYHTPPGRAVALTVYAIPNNGPSEFFGRLAGSDTAPRALDDVRTTDSLLIGWLQTDATEPAKR